MRRQRLQPACSGLRGCRHGARSAAAATSHSSPTKWHRQAEEGAVLQWWRAQSWRRSTRTTYVVRLLYLLRPCHLHIGACGERCVPPRCACVQRSRRTGWARVVASPPTARTCATPRFTRLRPASPALPAARDLWVPAGCRSGVRARRASETRLAAPAECAAPLPSLGQSAASPVHRSKYRLALIALHDRQWALFPGGTAWCFSRSERR